MPHAKQGIIDSALWLVDVKFRRHYVEIASQNHRHIEFEQFGGIGRKALKPTKLVVKLRPRIRIAVRQIEAPDNNTIDHSFDVPAVYIFCLSRQPFSG
jgi:hypothetical protein